MTLFWLFLAVYQLNCTRTHHTLVRKCKSKPLSPGRNWLKVRRHSHHFSVLDKLKDKLFVRNIIKYLDWDNKEICWTHHLPYLHTWQSWHMWHTAHLTLDWAGRPGDLRGRGRLTVATDRTVHRELLQSHSIQGLSEDDVCNKRIINKGKFS